MRPCDKEDLRQEKLLAELEGKAFDVRAFSKNYLRHSEVTCADVERIHTQVPRSKEKRPIGMFQTQSATYRDEKLRELLSGLLAQGLTQKQIALELTKCRAPKATWWNNPGWRKWGVRGILRRLGLGVGQDEGRRMGGRAKDRPPSLLCTMVCEMRLSAWSYCEISEYLGVSFRCVSRSVNRGIGDEGKQMRYRLPSLRMPKGTNATAADAAGRACGS